jgi:hypothetical protein
VQPGVTGTHNKHNPEGVEYFPDIQMTPFSKPAGWIKTSPFYLKRSLRFLIMFNPSRGCLLHCFSFRIKRYLFMWMNMTQNGSCSTRFEKPNQYQQGFQRILMQLAENRCSQACQTILENQQFRFLKTS